MEAREEGGLLPSDYVDLQRESGASMRAIWQLVQAWVQAFPVLLQVPAPLRLEGLLPEQLLAARVPDVLRDHRPAGQVGHHHGRRDRRLWDRQDHRGLQDRRHHA